MRDIAPGTTVLPLSKSSSEFAKGATSTIYVGPSGAGTFTGVDKDGNTVTDYNLVSGYHPLRVKVWSAGTATDIWGLWNNT